MVSIINRTSVLTIHAHPVIILLFPAVVVIAQNSKSLFLVKREEFHVASNIFDYNYYEIGVFIIYCQLFVCREFTMCSGYMHLVIQDLSSCGIFSGSFLFGLAIDMVSGLVYYTEGGADIIAVMTLDGKYQFTLISEDMDQPQDIALDPPRG